MRMAYATVALVGFCLSLSGCGDLYRRNELFSSAVAKSPPPDTVQIAAAARSPATLEPTFDDGQPASRVAGSARIAPPAGRARSVEIASAEQPRPRTPPSPSVVRAKGAGAEVGATSRTALKDDRSGDGERRTGTSLASAAPPGDASSARSDISDTNAVRPAGGAQILAGLLRVWNKVAIAEMSSKVLFNVWPEDIDGKRPTDNEIAKREVQVQ